MIPARFQDLADRLIAPRLRRFFVVGTFAASVQQLLLFALVDVVNLEYRIGAAIAIEITIILSYLLNNAWTFRASQHTTRATYLVGLVKTNLVRGTSIPIQLGILTIFVEWLGVFYLIANGGAILISGLYRYALDSRWTWN